MMLSLKDIDNMGKRIQNSGLIQRNVRRGIRFLDGGNCYKVINIYTRKIGIISKGVKTEIPREHFYEVLNRENPNIILAWREYEEIIGN